jgi:three-Cys-motif partner protein
MGLSNSFFDKQTKRSKIKANIVANYFAGWANVIASRKNVQKIAYIDLFAGPGRYEDGNPSTPLLVLEKAINHPKAPQKLQAIFNDYNPEFAARLKSEIDSLRGIEFLRFKPVVYNKKIDQKIVAEFENFNSIPALSFVDPYGYKGLSLPLIRALVKSWGCDSIFFFNYRRLNPGIENIALKDPISIVFTEEVLLNLREKVCGKSSCEREVIIINKIKDVFREWGMDYVLQFPYKNKSGKRTTHHLVFVTKNILGHNIMKGIMGKASTHSIQDVPSFEYNPAPVQTSLFEGPLDGLKNNLIKDFAGRTMKMKEIFEKHNLGKPFIEKNYKAALLALEEEQKIKTTRMTRKPIPRKGTFPDDLIVKFPKKGN